MTGQGQAEVSIESRVRKVQNARQNSQNQEDQRKKQEYGENCSGRLDKTNRKHWHKCTGDNGENGQHLEGGGEKHKTGETSGCDSRDILIGKKYSQL